MIDATPEEHLESAVAAGHASFRLPIEWARAEPVEGHYDEAVFERYASVGRAGHALGLEPVVVVHHVELPGWLGADFWTRLEAPDRFRAWTVAVADRLGDHGVRFVTFAEPNAVAWQGWITGALPPHRVVAVGDLVRALDHMMTAHVLASAAVHLDRPTAVSELEVQPMPVYELDGLLLDVLTVRTQGIGRHDLRPWLNGRRRDWYRNRPPPTVVGRAMRHLARIAIPLEQALPRTVVAVFDGA